MSQISAGDLLMKLSLLKLTDPAKFMLQMLVILEELERREKHGPANVVGITALRDKKAAEKQRIDELVRERELKG